MSGRIILHIDLDMFFAAVELKEQPELKGKPVIVGNKNARESRRGVVKTCTYEARDYGIRSGMPMHQALTLCPQAIIVNDANHLYRPTSKRIMDILKSLDTPYRITSIDEAYVDITPIANKFIEAQIVARKIKSLIYEQEGITCSIGIGPTLKIAKIASDFNKPDGITTIQPKMVLEFFKLCKLTDIPGIGNVTGKKLQDMGYNSCASLVDKSRIELHQELGSLGLFLYKVFHAQTKNYIGNRGKRKSISHETTFHGKPGEINRYQKIIENLFDKSYTRLIENNWTTKTINAKIRFNGFATKTRSYSLPLTTNNRKILKEHTFQLINPYLNDKRGIRLLGVGFSNLTKMEFNQTKLNQHFQ